MQMLYVYSSLKEVDYIHFPKCMKLFLTEIWPADKSNPWHNILNAFNKIIICSISIDLRDVRVLHLLLVINHLVYRLMYVFIRYQSPWVFSCL